MKRTQLLKVLPLLLAFAPACALGPGGPTAELQPRLRARYLVPEDRATDDGYAKLATDYEVRMEMARATFRDVRVFASGAASGGGGGTFDPANPPAGYSLCHNGHCHSDAGALVPYAQIEAELAGGGGATEALVAFLPANVQLDLLANMQQVLGCEPDCALAQTTLTRVAVGVSRLELRGTVRDSRGTPRVTGELPFTLVVELPEGSLGAEATTAVKIPVDRGHSPELGLRAEVAPGPSVFDSVEWAALEQQDGAVELAAPGNSEAAAGVLSAFAGSLAAFHEVEVAR